MGEKHAPWVSQWLLWKKLTSPGTRQEMTYNNIILTEKKYEQAAAAFKHAIQTILLSYTPGKMQKRCKTKHLWNHVQANKPKIRVLKHEKTQFFPLPEINEEEASIPGTIRVVQSIFTKLLAMSEDIIPTRFCLLVGDWLSIRNLRLMKDERAEEFISYLRMDWIQEHQCHFTSSLMRCMPYTEHIWVTSSRRTPAHLSTTAVSYAVQSLIPRSPSTTKQKN